MKRLVWDSIIAIFSHNANRAATAGPVGWPCMCGADRGSKSFGQSDRWRPEWPPPGHVSPARHLAT